jgi:TBC1 domain family member 20
MLDRGISGDKASKLLQPPSADDSAEWQMAGSRKTRRKMSSQKSSSSQALSQASGSEAGDRLDGLFGSAVDVKSAQVSRSDSPQAPARSQQDSSSSSSSPLLPSDAASVHQSSSSSASPEPNHSSFSTGPSRIEAADGWQKAGKKRSKRRHPQETSQTIGTVQQQQQLETKSTLPKPVPQPSDDDQQKNSTPAATKPKPRPFESQSHSKPVNAVSYSDHLPAHRDEHQVDLDVRRSFIGFDTHGKGSRDARRRQLSDIIVGTLRRHPALNYYQGYHDVVSVLLLVISPENPTSTDQPWASEADFNLVLQANIRFTLFYLRDFLAKRLDPCLGWLKVLRNIIREEDEDLARRVVERANPLPFFALSWVISAFCHDLKFQSEEAKQVLDQVLVKGPEIILKLVAALILERGGRKIEGSDDGENEEDPAMLHHALAGLPGQLESEGGDLSLQTLIKRANSISSSYLASKETIMGLQSILRCWSPLLSMTEEKLPVLEKQAESYLSLPADRIVIDPTPSPPAISPSIEEKEGGYFNENKSRPIRSTASKGSKTVLLVGGVTILVAGTAVFLQATAGHDRHSQKQALKEMSELGRGLFSLAICGAAGIC